MSTKRQKIIEIVAAAVVLAGVVAILCWPGRAKAPKADHSLSRVMAAKKLVVGLAVGFPPMEFLDRDEKLVGFDLDMGRAVCAKLGIELAVKEMIWNEKYDFLNSGAIDCIWSGMAVTPERAHKVDFSAPYIYNELVFVVNRGSDVKSAKDLSGKRVGLFAASTAPEVLRAAGLADDLKAVEYEDPVDVFDNLQSGAIDAALADSLSAFHYLAIQKRPLVILPGCLRKEQLAIAFRKGDLTLRDGIQAAIDELKADGTLAKISAKWFGSNLVP